MIEFLWFTSGFIVVATIVTVIDEGLKWWRR